jgi:prepilin-type N-terminal cleavage/methylation domain-containing protein
MPAAGPRARSAFTLIELLVVIAIIGILVGLTLAFILPMFRQGPDLQDLNEISQMQIAINNFKTKTGTYPPSKIRLRQTFSNYKTTDPLDVDSVYYLSKIWPRMGDFKKYAWDGVAAKQYVLEGDQCLVFFLGGLFGTQGFSADPTDPCGKSAKRIPPYMQFDAGRLQVRSSAPTQNPAFPSYYNNWRVPTQQFYAYFSSGRAKNGYHSGGNVSHAIAGMDNVTPYYDFTFDPKTKLYSITDYLNPASFQIISAGEDGRFTQASAPALPPDSPTPPQRGTWKVGAVSSDSTEFWKDNRSNFTPNQLQVP